MAREHQNIYKTCRRACGLTQEAAAERLNISVESIRAYETGQRIPPNDIVEQMVVLYNAQHLAYQHLRETNAIYARLVPQVPQCSVLEAAAKLTNRIYAFADAHADRRLMQIAEDNIIDPDERPEFQAILAELQDIVEAALAVRCAEEGYIKTP